MTKRDRPFISYRNRQGKVVQFEFPTYRELKKNLKEHLKNVCRIEYCDEDYSDTTTIHVTRYKRGEWGEWFENWQMVNNKPTKLKEGWM